MSRPDQQRLDDTLDALARSTAQRAATEGDLFVANLLLNDWLLAMQADTLPAQLGALQRVAMETQTFLASLSPNGPAGAASQGEGRDAPAGTEGQGS